MFNNMKIGMKLGLGFGLVILLAVALGVMSWLKVQEIGTEWGSFEAVNLRKQAALTDGFSDLQEGIRKAGGDGGRDERPGGAVAKFDDLLQGQWSSGVEK